MLQSPQSCVDAGNSLTVVAAVSNFYYSRPTESDRKSFSVLFFWLQGLDHFLYTWFVLTRLRFDLALLARRTYS